MSENIVEALPTYGLNGDDEPTAIIEPTKRTVFDTLKAQRALQAAEKTIDIEIPGWSGCLALRLGSISGAEHSRLAEKAARQNVSSVIVNTDFLVAAFRHALARETTDAPWMVLTDDEGDPMGLDTRITEALGLTMIPVHSARDVVAVLYTGANSPAAAISAAANQWGEWARDAGSEVDELFVGE